VRYLGCALAALLVLWLALVVLGLVLGGDQLEW
jgi:hypothetical protein